LHQGILGDDLTEDLKKIDVPTLILHGDDDQIANCRLGLLSAKLVKKATLKVTRAVHTVCARRRRIRSTDLLAFIKGKHEKMKAAQISKPGGDLELVERDVPEPGPGQVRVKVEACGICHSDMLVKEGLWPGLQYPRVPGHEVAGRIDAVGSGVTNWKEGQRVGVGWHGGHCFACEQCRRGDFAMCINRKITGIDFDGGYAEYMIARQEASAIPGITAEEAALCAQVLRSLMHCNSVRAAIWWRYTALADWGISEFNTHDRWDSRPWRSAEGRTRSRWRGNSARIITLIPALATRPRSGKRSAAPA
jgi:alcohol dehydrogenase/propanol-preferring alcohol dehydrogenase